MKSVQLDFTGYVATEMKIVAASSDASAIGPDHILLVSLVQGLKPVVLELATKKKYKDFLAALLKGGKLAGWEDET